MRNVMNWNCNRDGCFNEKCRLKFAVFENVFPRRINFTDVDALVEIGGSFCMLEWKGDGGSLKRAQELAYRRFTENNSNAVVVVYGDAETMTVRSFGYFLGGDYHPATVSDLDGLRRWLSVWAQRVEVEV